MSPSGTRPARISQWPVPPVSTPPHSSRAATQAALAAFMFPWFMQPSPGTQPARYWFSNGSDQQGGKGLGGEGLGGGGEGLGGEGLGGGGEGGGGEGDGGGGEGDGGGGLGEGGGGEGETHPLHSRTSWSSWATESNLAWNSACSSTRRAVTASLIASEHPQVVVGADIAVTLPSRQKATRDLSSRMAPCILAGDFFRYERPSRSGVPSSLRSGAFFRGETSSQSGAPLSRRVHLILGMRRGDLVCPGEWPSTLGVSFFMVRCW